VDMVKILTVLSLVIESLTKTVVLILNIALKPMQQWSEEEKKHIVTAILSVIITLGINLDIFILAGIPFQVPILGPLLTGLLFARGAGVVNDIIDIIYYTKINKRLKALK
jgi:hypothetical protein